MRPRMSVEDEWKARLAKRKAKEAASAAKGSCGLAPSRVSGTSSGSIATPKRRTTTGKHHAN